MPRPSEPVTAAKAGATVSDERRHEPLVALAACLALYALALVLFPSTGDQDAAIHAIYAEHPTDPSRYLSAYARPLFAVPYLLPALAGYTAMRVTSVLLCAGSGWLTYLAARRLGTPHAWLAIPLVMLQPALYVVGVDVMTEPTFAFVLAAGLLALAHERTAVAAAVLSFLPLARPEGPFVLACLALLWLPALLRAPRFWLPRFALLGLGMVVWQLATTAITGNPRYLLDTFSYRGNAYPWRGTWNHYVKRWPQIVGWGTLALWLAGAWASARPEPAASSSAAARPPGLRLTPRELVLRLSLLVTLLLFVLHSYLYHTGGMASTGFDRYFATIAPMVALVAVVGAGGVVRWLGPRRRRAAAATVGAMLALDAVHSFIAIDSNPNSHMGAKTLESVRQGRRLVPDFDARPFLSADYFGYVFLGRDRGADALPVLGHDETAPLIERFPPGTVVLWDNITGDWWFHLAVEDFTARGYRLLWERRGELRSPLAPLYARPGRWPHTWVAQLFGQWPYRDFRQAVLVKER